MLKLRSQAVGWLLMLGAALYGTAACRCSESPSEGAPSASAAPAVSIITSDPARPRVYFPEPPSLEVPIPVGPSFSILAGKGIGPIRIGATTATIERLMDLPCEVKTDTVCRYFSRAVEFQLKSDTTVAITVHRRGRPAGKDAQGRDRKYGLFNGVLPPDFQLLMLQSVLEEHLGTPQKKEPVHNQPEFNTTERHYYPGLIVEYDRLENGKSVLGEVEIVKSSVD